ADRTIAKLMVSTGTISTTGTSNCWTVRRMSFLAERTAEGAQVDLYTDRSPIKCRKRFLARMLGNELGATRQGLWLHCPRRRVRLSHIRIHLSSRGCRLLGAPQRASIQYLPF